MRQMAAMKLWMTYCAVILMIFVSSSSASNKNLFTACHTIRSPCNASNMVCMPPREALDTIWRGKRQVSELDDDLGRTLTYIRRPLSFVAPGFQRQLPRFGFFPFENKYSFERPSFPSRFSRLDTLESNFGDRNRRPSVHLSTEVAGNDNILVNLNPSKNISRFFLPGNSLNRFQSDLGGDAQLSTNYFAGGMENGHKFTRETVSPSSSVLVLNGDSVDNGLSSGDVRDASSVRLGQEFFSPRPVLFHNNKNRVFRILGEAPNLGDNVNDIDANAISILNGNGNYIPIPSGNSILGGGNGDVGNNFVTVNNIDGSQMIKNSDMVQNEAVVLPQQQQQQDVSIDAGVLPMSQSSGGSNSGEVTLLQLGQLPSNSDKVVTTHQELPVQIVRMPLVRLPDLNEMTVPGITRVQDSRSDSYRNRIYNTRREIHLYSLQRQLINKHINNIYRQHNHEHENVQNIINVDRIYHPHKELAYLTHIHTQYIPRNYIHRSFNEQIRMLRGGQQSVVPTTNTIQRVIRYQPVYDAPTTVYINENDQKPSVAPETVNLQQQSPEVAIGGETLEIGSGNLASVGSSGGDMQVQNAENSVVQNDQKTFDGLQSSVVIKPQLLENASLPNRLSDDERVQQQVVASKADRRSRDRDKLASSTEPGTSAETTTVAATTSSTTADSVVIGGGNVGSARRRREYIATGTRNSRVLLRNVEALYGTRTPEKNKGENDKKGICMCSPSFVPDTDGRPGCVCPLGRFAMPSTGRCE